MDFIIHGIPTLFKGPQVTMVNQCWPSAVLYKTQVQDFIELHVSNGNITGPLPNPPEGYRASPLGAFQRKHSGKIRVIHDLSWPPGGSVNDFIPAKDCALSYSTVDQAANLCLQFPEPWLIKVDLQSAFLSCPVRPQDRHLLGFVWPPGAVKDCYYFFNVLCFGMKSSPKQFNILATAMEYIIAKRGEFSTILHYMDDYVAVCPTFESAQQILYIMVSTFESAGFQVQPEKTLGPARALEYLGIMVDTVKQQLSISQERMDEISQLVQEWLGKSDCTKRELLSIIGKLSFSARVVRAGNKFLRRLIQLSKKAKNLHNKLKLDAAAKADLRWWAMCLESHNGVAWLDPKAHDTEATMMYTDASDLAAGAIYRDSWTVR